MKRSFVAGMAVIGVAFALSACGSGDGETTTEVKKVVYVKQANRLCASIGERYSSDLQSLVREKKQPEIKITSNRELLMGEVVLPILRELSRELETLGTPEGGWSGDTSLGEALDQAITEFEDDPGAITAGPDSPLHDFAAIAKRVGAEACTISL
jgi:hypothetical protein